LNPVSASSAPPRRALRLAFRGQVHVHPAGKPIFQVPLALAVAGQHKAGHGDLLKI
jgi:hypothetical protein